jgi:hypothetical protein
MDDCFELSILDTGRHSRVITIARCGFDLAIESISYKTLKQLMQFRARIVAAIAGTGARLTNTELSEFGQRLFRSAVQQTVNSVYSRLPNSHIRMQIYSDHPDIQAFPWEYIQPPGSPPGPDAFRSIVRVVPTIGLKLPPPLKLTKKRLQLVFIYSEPIDQDAVEWPDIKESIEREFKSRLPQNFSLTVVEAANRDKLFAALDGKSFDILHFVGHGEIGSDGTGKLVLQDLKTRISDPISVAQFGPFLKNKGLRLVTLSACSTSAGDFSKEFAVVAKSLVGYGIPAVVANQFPITNSSAATFAGAFYKELLRSGDVDLATTNGRIALAMEPALPRKISRHDWGTPSPHFTVMLVHPRYSEYEI